MSDGATKAGQLSGTKQKELEVLWWKIANTEYFIHCGNTNHNLKFFFENTDTIFSGLKSKGTIQLDITTQL